MKEFSDSFHINHSSTRRHLSVTKVTPHKVFPDEDSAYQFYDNFINVWKLDRSKIEVDAEYLKEKASVLIKKANKLIRDYDAEAFVNIPHKYPEEFIWF